MLAEQGPQYSSEQLENYGNIYFVKYIFKDRELTFEDIYTAW